MDKYHLPAWLLKAITVSGGFGLLGVSFLDSTILPFPSLNDLLLIDLCIESPLRMPYYAAMATLGSVAGSVLLYFLARKGEEAAFHKKAGSQAPRIHHWIVRNGFATVVVAALLPPPTPFKLFVLAAGALGMPFRTFLAAMSFARGVRFFAEGYLAIRYGQQATHFLIAHSMGFAISTIAFFLAFFWILKVSMRRAPGEKA